MRLIVLTSLVLLAFAANSILNRMAVGSGEIAAMAFANIRAMAGAATLACLVLAQRRSLPLLRAPRIVGAGSLALYLAGFSVAYLQMDAGLGALILFGGVQVTMFAGAVMGGDRPLPARWIGSALALAGLAWLSWPSGPAALPLGAVLAMFLAALGWGLYSLAGRHATDPMAETGANFIWAVPVLAIVTLALPASGPVVPATAMGIALAVLAGSVTSGLGYALWYHVLPQLGGAPAALVQLAVPVIAMAAGVALLGEEITWPMAGAAALTLGGIAYGLGAPQRRTGSSGS